MEKKRQIILNDMDVAYIEMGDPLWFVLAISEDEKRMDIIVVPGKDEEEAKSKVSSDNIVRCVQLYNLLDRARIMAGFIKAVNET